MIKATIVGGSGYAGGELLRLLLAHPEIELAQVTSRSHLGEYVYQVHPNLRKQTMLKFTDPDTIQPVDLLFLALPHGTAQHKIDAIRRHWPPILSTCRRISACTMRRIMNTGTVLRMRRRHGWPSLSMACPNCTGTNCAAPITPAAWAAMPPPATWPYCRWSKPA